MLEAKPRYNHSSLNFHLRRYDIIFEYRFNIRLRAPGSWTHAKIVGSFSSTELDDS